MVERKFPKLEAAGSTPVSRSISCAAAPFFFLLLFLPFLLTAQSVREEYEVFTTRSGLPHNNVLRIAQDPYGYLWVGTNNGLSRYDGQEFRSYRDLFASMGNPWGNAVDALVCDGNDLWIGTRGSLLACMDVRTGKTKHITLPNSPAASGYGVHALCSLGDKLYIGCYDGTLLVLSKSSGTFSVRKLAGFAIKKIQVLNGMVTAFADSLYVINEQGQARTWRIKGLDMDPSNIVAGEHQLMITRVNNTLFYDMHTGQVSEQPLSMYSGNYPFSGVYHKGYFIAIHHGFISTYDQHGRLKKEFRISESTSGQWTLVNDLFIDRSGVVWIGLDYGLVKVVESRYRFRKYHTDNLFRRISHNYIRAVFAEKDRLWVGTKWGYINCLDFRKSREYPAISSYRVHVPASLNHTATVNTLCRTRDNQLLAGGLEGLMYKDGDHFSPYPFRHIAGVPDFRNQVWALVQDRRGRIWIGTAPNGLYILDEQNRQLKHIVKEDGTGLQSNDIWSIFEDSEGTLWLGTGSGLVQANVDDRGQITFSSWQHFATNAPAGIQAWQIIEDADKNLWIGFPDKGLSYYDRRTKHFTNYSERNGLPSDAVSGLLDDGARIWISTMNGIASLDKKSRQIIPYSEEDGLISNDFNFKACARMDDGQLFWGTKLGLMGFYPPGAIQEQRSHALLKRTELKVMGNTVEMHDTLELSNDENMFSIRFALLDYTYPSRYIYRYCLNGFDKIWNYTGSGNAVATYTNLPPGQYEWTVEAFTGNKQTPAARTSMWIIVHPAFWQTTWFWVLAVALFLCIAGLAAYLRFRWLLKAERDRHTMMQKVAELELQALQSQMNPHFIFNAVSSIQHFIIRNDEVTANEYLTKFARLMRLFLESSKRKLITLEEELEILNLYTDLEKLRFEDKFSVAIEVDDMLNPARTELPSMLIQPFAENAIIHGLNHLVEKGHLCIKFIALDEGIECVIDDNGIGRARSAQLHVQQHTSRAMSLIRERLQTYAFIKDSPYTKLRITDKQDEAGNACGTRVEITILYN